jgi:hypothetical protein
VTELSDQNGAASPETASLSFDEWERLQLSHRCSVRFAVALNAALAVATLGILKMDGPWYADGIVAGLFAFGFGFSLFAWRGARRGEAVLRAAAAQLADVGGERGKRAAEMGPGCPRPAVFLLFAAFFLAASVASVWFTYLSREQVPMEEDAVADAVAQVVRSPRGAYSESGP